MRADGLLASRIDIIGCPFLWLHCVTSCSILPCPYSDHSAVVLVSSVSEPFPRGPRKWKLNISILRDSAFIKSVKEFWASWQRQKFSFPSLASWWDRGKALLKGLAISFCRRQSDERRQSRTVLTSLASHLKSLVDAGRVSLLRIFHRVQSQIAQLDRFEAESAKVRSRIRWAEEGESSSSFFFPLERKHGSSCWISAMRLPDSSLATDISSFCNSWVSFYSDLFSAKPADSVTQTKLLSNVSAHLSSDSRDSC